MNPDENKLNLENRMSCQNLSRRNFLSTVAATSALALPASAQPIGANNRINIGLIGTGGRCRCNGSA